MVVIVLVEQVRVGRQRHRRLVAGLARDVDHGRALRDQQADEAVAQVIRPRLRDAGVLRGLGERALAPVADAVGVPRRAVRRGKDQVEVLAVVRGRPPVEQVLLERREQPDRAGRGGLRRLQLPERDRTLDEQRALAEVMSAQPDRLAGSKAGVGQDGDEGRVEPAVGLE